LCVAALYIVARKVAIVAKEKDFFLLGWVVFSEVKQVQATEQTKISLLNCIGETSINSYFNCYMKNMLYVISVKGMLLQQLKQSQSTLKC